MKRVKAAIIVGAIALVGIGAGSPAVAGSSLCGASKVCIYDDQGFVGLLGSRSGGLGAVNVSTGTNDQTSSWENKSSYNGRWHTNANSSGTCRKMAAKKELSYVGSTDNDKLTSWATNGGC